MTGPSFSVNTPPKLGNLLRRVLLKSQHHVAKGVSFSGDLEIDRSVWVIEPQGCVANFFVSEEGLQDCLAPSLQLKETEERASRHDVSRYRGGSEPMILQRCNVI